MRGFFRVAAVAAAALFLAPAATAAASAATARPDAGVAVRGGTTAITTVSGLVTKLAASGVGIFATDPATGTLTGTAANNPQLRLVLPIASGQLSPVSQSGTIIHKGGFLVVSFAARQQVRFSSLVADFGQKTVTGNIDNSKVTKATLFQMDLSNVHIRPGGRGVRISNIGLVLTATGAKVLDSILKVNVFTAGMKIATAVTSARF